MGFTIARPRSEGASVLTALIAPWKRSELNILMAWPSCCSTAALPFNPAGAGISQPVFEVFGLVELLISRG